MAKVTLQGQSPVLVPSAALCFWSWVLGCVEEARAPGSRWGRGHRFSPRLPQGFGGSPAASLWSWVLKFKVTATLELPFFTCC